MPTDTASFGVTATPVPVIAAAGPAIAQAPRGHFLLVDLLTMLGAPEQRRCLFDSFLAGGRLETGLAER